ncbi:Transposase IS116/IS110/IS902 family protein [Bradyrhizobium sp. Ghvi]|nr:IS110 family transposase [Bradyrhizobium sp. Ghvi]SFQ33480.1 Transposase IS116/IS110/IS902 family protein [Bradyrhizobium sp. Ghvi]
MQIVGMDIHRSFVQVAILEDGTIIRQLRVDVVHHRLVAFAKTLSLEDEVVIEVTGNSAAVERILRPHVKRVAVANPRLVRTIAYARVKTDKVDARTLAKLHAAGFLPEVWVADEDTQSRRRQMAERAGVLAQIIRIKARMKAILHANLIPPYKGYLFGKRGQHWPHSLPLPSKERAMLQRLITELERVTKQLSEIDKVVAQQALDDRRALKLMTIPGVSSVVASNVLASIGDIARFQSPDKLSSYFGLTPRVGNRESIRQGMVVLAHQTIRHRRTRRTNRKRAEYDLGAPVQTPCFEIPALFWASSVSQTMRSRAVAISVLSRPATMPRQPSSIA